MTKDEQIDSLLQTVASQEQVISGCIDSYNKLNDTFTELLSNSFISQELKDVYLESAYGK